MKTLKEMNAEFCDYMNEPQDSVLRSGAHTDLLAQHVYKQLSAQLKEANELIDNCLTDLRLVSRVDDSFFIKEWVRYFTKYQAKYP